MSTTQSLRQMLAQGEFVIAPGVYDMFSARIADALDFKALYMTGYGVSGSHAGLPDAGLVTYTEMVGRAAAIAEGITRPLIADADTGFGGAFNIARTVREMERAGVAAIHLEDQEQAKRCGHRPNKATVAVEEMCDRLRAAVDARRDEIVEKHLEPRIGRQAAQRRRAAVARDDVGAVALPNARRDDFVAALGPDHVGG